MKEKTYITRSEVPLNTSVSEIREELAKLGINGMTVDVRWDVNSGACMVGFVYNGQKYERRSTQQPNASKNMRAIFLNLKHKVLDHLRGVEPFEASMHFYKAIEGSTTSPPPFETPSVPEKEVLAAYADIGAFPYDSEVELRKKYHQNVKAWHPDRFNSDPQMLEVAQKKTSKINEAWNTIKKARRIQ